MCCCQLAAAVAHLLPVLNSACLCFVTPKQGPDSWPKNGATILKWIAQLPNLWSNFGPMVYAFCLLQRARWAATGCIFHSCFLALGARMLVSHAGYAEKEGKKHAGPAPKMGPRRSASQRNVSKGAGMPVLFCSKHARLNFDCHKQCKDMCTASGSVQDPMGATPGTPRHQSWLASALCKAATPGKAARLAFVSGNVDSWGAGPCLRAHIHIHLAEAALN